MTGTFVYIKKDYSQNFFKNGWKMRCLWPSENQRNWTFDMIYWALRHDQNHSNWNLANILAWKTSFIIGLSYFIHLWKSFCLKLALNLSDPQAPHITTIFEKVLQTILIYVNKMPVIYWFQFVNLPRYLRPLAPQELPPVAFLCVCQHSLAIVLVLVLAITMSNSV